MKINKVASLILIFFLLGCNSISQPTSTQTESLPSFTPTLVNTPEPTPTSTPAPSKIEKLTHAFAYGEENNIFIVNENGKSADIVKTEIGWIKDFKFSADNTKVVFSIIEKGNKAALYGSGSGYGLYLRSIGDYKDTEILPLADGVIFFEWLNSEEIIIVTLKDTFVWSINDAKQKIDEHPLFFTNAKDSYIDYIKSPNQKSVLLSQQKFGIDGYPSGCAFYYVDFEKVHTVEILKSEDCNGIFDKNWSPDGKVISIRYREKINNASWNPALLFDVTSEEVAVSSDENTLLSWSPDGKFYSSSNFNSFFVRVSGSENEENYYQHSSSIYTQVVGWSPNSQYFVYTDGGYPFIFNTKDKTEKRIFNYPDLEILSLNGNKFWWLPDSSGFYFTATDNNNKTAIFYLPLGTKKYELVGETLEFPNNNFLHSGKISFSPDNKYSAVYYNKGYVSCYLLIDNQTKLSISLLKTASPLSIFQWLK